MTNFKTLQASEKEIKQLRNRENIDAVITDILSRYDKSKKRSLRRAERKQKKQPIKVNKPIPVEVAEEYRLIKIQEQTPSEQITKINLKILGYKYVFQYVVWARPDKFYIGDFYLPELGLILEIDGEYHNDRAQQIKDNKRTTEIEAKGYKIVRMTNGQCGNTDYHRQKLQTLLEENKQDLRIVKGLKQS